MSGYTVWCPSENSTEPSGQRYHVDALGPREAATLFVQRELAAATATVVVRVRCPDGTVKAVEVGVELEPRFYAREVANE